MTRWIVLLAALAGCGSTSGRAGGSGNGGGVGSGGSGGGSGGGPIDTNGACAKMDILFVVDNSGSMAEEQLNLGANFPKFISVLSQFKTKAGADLDWRVAVATTGRDVDYTLMLPPPFGTSLPTSEKGENGNLQQKCGMTRRWIERYDNVDVAQQFACVAKVGTGGPGWEMPLEAGVRLTFDERIKDGANAGFLRDDALLAVVILSDEDDCSRKDNHFTADPSAPNACIEPVANYVAFLDTLKGARGRWAAAVVAGPGPGDCSSSFGMATEAKRLQDFVHQTGTNAVFSSICDGDLSKSLADALETFNAACESFPPIG